MDDNIGALLSGWVSAIATAFAAATGFLVYRMSKKNNVIYEDDSTYHISRKLHHIRVLEDGTSTHVINVTIIRNKKANKKIQEIPFSHEIDNSNVFPLSSPKLTCKINGQDVSKMIVYKRNNKHQLSVGLVIPMSLREASELEVEIEVNFGKLYPVTEGELKKTRKYNPDLKQTSFITEGVGIVTRVERLYFTVSFAKGYPINFDELCCECLHPGNQSSQLVSQFNKYFEEGSGDIVANYEVVNPKESCHYNVRWMI